MQTLLVVFVFKCQKSHNYQHLYEEMLASHSARSQEVAELKLSLQQTQQGISIFQNFTLTLYYFPALKNPFKVVTI